MPPNKGKSSLMKNLGPAGRKAFDTHKKDDTTFDTQAEIPAGIEGGVAQLTACYFAEHKEGDNKGKMFWRAAGIILSPDTYAGKKAKGLPTSIMEVLYDTPNRSRKLMEEHLGFVMNQMRMLGVDTDGLDYDDLETACKALVQAKPIFGFRTWKGEPTPQFKNPSTQSVWQGLVEETPTTETEDVVVDDSDDDDDDDDGDDEPATDSPEVDLTALAGAADNDEDEGAQVKLKELAAAAGLDIDTLPTWADVANDIEGVEAPAEAEAEAEAEETSEHVPEKENIYNYTPAGKKNPVECEVIAVFKKNKTVNLRNIDDGKTTYKAVKWGELSEDQPE